MDGANHDQLWVQKHSLLGGAELQEAADEWNVFLLLKYLNTSAVIG